MQYSALFVTRYTRVWLSARSTERTWQRTLCAAALLTALGQTTAWSAIIQVSSGTPPSIKADGRCSLIEAIVNANSDSRFQSDCDAGSGADTIRLPVKSQQQLEGPESVPTITSAIVIEGRGSDIVRDTHDGLYVDSTFFFVSSSGNLTLNRVNVSGAAGGFGYYGYGVANQGHLALVDSSIAHTGGLWNFGGVAVLRRSRVTDNVPPAGYLHQGGGILNHGGSTLIVTNSVISRNEGAGMGGGIFNDVSSTASVTDSVVSHNRVTFSGHGGGIANSGSLLVVGTDITDNDASNTGGGIFNDGGTATIRRSTISRNHGTCSSCLWRAGGGIDNRGKLKIMNSTVSNNGGSVAYGGGVLSYQRTGPSCPCAEPALVILDSTITGNRADASIAQDGGGVYVEAGALTLKRSIISGNQASTGREILVSGGVLADEYNLFGHDGDAGVSGFTPSSTDIAPNVSLRNILLPLADNGGGTKTHALAIGSPALDAYNAGCPAVDQRGNPRPRGPACDIGAFEGVAVLCNGKVTTMVGTVNDDHLTGTPGPDVISGLLGDDVISGLGGDDVVCGGAGADVVYGGLGNDLLFGEPGDDRLFGQGGDDTLNGGAGPDVCDGGAGAGDTSTVCENVSGVP